MKIQVLSLAILIATAGIARGQQEDVYHESGVSFAYPGWERFEPPHVREGELMSVRLGEPLRACTLARIDTHRAGDNATQEWINARMTERADAFVQTMRHAGMIVSTETLTIDGVTVIDARTVGVQRTQPDRGHDRFFAVRHQDQVSSYWIDCLVFGEETPADRAAVDALMNSLHFD